jgi:hypothetical protein
MKNTIVTYCLGIGLNMFFPQFRTHHLVKNLTSQNLKRK